MRTRLAAALVLLLHLLAPIAASGPALAPSSHPSAIQALEAVLTQVVQAPGHSREERASRGHSLAVAPVASGGPAVLPGTAVPVTGSRRAAVAGALSPPSPRPDRRAAPARAPPLSTR
ncbi:hypothetical protein HTZ77_16965 [Nonomuraea sp. SMC257]|uniref:Uncharacterized protein n=1 Tax=Nonomuraea montanisoli TaxID=2741721 RepID=A0A7Y6I7G8_9ACTN|nr:hypothetical protein [Nonomuraea montanisoli]NUW33112.1 hypothetical protein [Nonomuraea montanisoli]